jgi:hypothetical protein
MSCDWGSFFLWHCRKNQRRRKCGLIFPFFKKRGPEKREGINMISVDKM